MSPVAMRTLLTTHQRHRLRSIDAAIFNVGQDLESIGVVNPLWAGYLDHSSEVLAGSMQVAMLVEVKAHLLALTPVTYSVIASPEVAAEPGPLAGTDPSSVACCRVL